nr:uncharacterized protein LOC128693878 [Cherax quadricarinatus]
MWGSKRGRPVLLVLHKCTVFFPKLVNAFYCLIIQHVRSIASLFGRFFSVDERSRATLKTLPQPLPLGKQHRAEGRDSGDAAAGVGSYGNAACIGGGGVSWSSSGEAAGRRNDEDTAEEMKRTLGRRHQELEDDEGREKRKLRVMKQLQEEPVSGLVTTKGRSVQSLVVYLSDRIHMYSPSNTSVSGSPLARCQSEDEVDYHRSPDLDSPLDSGDSSTSDESSADEESIADDECSVGENSLSEDESISDDESNAGEESNINDESFIDNESNAGNEYIDGSFLDDNIFDEAENAAFTLKQVNEDTHLSSINAQTRATSTLGQHPSEAASDREPGNMTEGILTRAKLLSDSLEASGKRPSEDRMTTLVTGYTGTTKKSPNDNISENSVNDEITAHEKSQGEDKLIIGQLPKEVCGDSASLGQPEAEGETPETLQVLLAETIIHSATPITQTETAAREDLETASLMDDETKDVYNISLKETESSSVTLRRNKVANYSSAPPKPPRARISGFPSTILKDTCSRFQEIPREFQNSENITEHSNEEVQPFNQDESHRYNLNCNSVGNTEMEGSKGIGTSQRAKSSTTCDAHNNSVRSSNVMRSADDLRVMHKPAIQNIVDKISLSPAHQKESSITRAGCIKKRTREPNSCPETKTTHTPSSGTTTTHTPSSGTTMTHTLSPGTMTTRTSRILGSSSKSRQDAPKKPARNSQRKPSLRSLEQDQEPCTAHGIPLNLYCGKCREVMCQECTVHHQEAHRVLNTPDALATLRTEAVTLLRHYMILKSLHDTLIQVYTKYIKYSTQVSLPTRLNDSLHL